MPKGSPAAAASSSRVYLATPLPIPFAVILTVGKNPRAKRSVASVMLIRVEASLAVTMSAARTGFARGFFDKLRMTMGVGLPIRNARPG